MSKRLRTIEDRVSTLVRDIDSVLTGPGVFISGVASSIEPELIATAVAHQLAAVLEEAVGNRDIRAIVGAAIDHRWRHGTNERTIRVMRLVEMAVTEAYASTRRCAALSGGAA